MPLEMHPNDNAREARPGLWIFQGRSVVLLVVGVAAFVVLFRILDWAGWEWPINVVISFLPLLALGTYVHVFVNSKPQSYSADLFLGLLWRGRVWLYMAGALDHPPQFWIRLPAPRHPNQFLGRRETVTAPAA
jgi:hypothetical protein